MKEKTDRSLNWGSVSAILAGATFLVPLLFYFHFLPAAGFSPAMAKAPHAFLPRMAENETVRTALWWSVSLPFLIALLGVPNALKRRLELHNPLAASTAETAGVMGFFTLLLSSLMLAAGESPLARAYAAAGDPARSAIASLYEWQRLVTALLFDFLGFFLVGVMILVGSAAGLHSGGLPKGLGWFGVLAATTCFFFAIGYVADLSWLGETGIGMSAFLTVPVWMIWLGIVFRRK